MDIIISEMEIFYCSLISPSLFQWFSCHLFFSTSVLKGGLKLCVVWSEQKGGGVCFKSWAEGHLLCAALMLPFDIKMQREKRRGNSNITAIW